MVHFVLVHIGNEIPPYLRDCIEQIQLVCKIPIHVLSSPSVLNQLKYDIHKVDLNSIPQSEHDIHFTNTNALQVGFWRSASQRFFVLHNYMKQHSLTDVFHIEYDNLIYYDVSKLLDTFRTKEMWVVMDAPTRCIPGFMYIKSSTNLEDVLPTIIAGAARGQNDMVTLAIYANKTNSVGQLPIVNPSNQFDILFDGAAIGQYIGGVDPRNNPTNTIGFINKTTIFSCAEQTIEWKQSSVGIVPFMNNLPLVNLHIHSKDLQRWRSKPKFITGEVIQETCDVYLGLEEDFAYNPRIKVQTEKQKTILSLNEPWNNPRTIFCYAHRIALFKTKQQFLTNPYILVTHNSDQNITDVSLLTDPKLVHWYAQNLLVDHPKASMLPIGIANSMWPHGNLSVMNQVLHSLKQKTNHIYFYFNMFTNTSARIECYSKLRQNGFMFGTQKSYKDYLDELVTHDYAICPPGNGIDSHRIWECLYLNVCPIMLKDTFSLKISKFFPVILVDDWSTLFPNMLQKRSHLIPIPMLEQFYRNDDMLYNRS